jgi:hypothetical protein
LIDNAIKGINDNAIKGTNNSQRLLHRT